MLKQSNGWQQPQPTLSLVIVLKMPCFCLSLIFCQHLSLSLSPFLTPPCSGVYKVDIEAVLIMGCSYFGQQTNKEVILVIMIHIYCQFQFAVSFVKSSTMLHVASPNM